MAARLKRRDKVQNRWLKIWLTDDERVTTEADWREQLASREEQKDKRSEVKRKGFEAKYLFEL